MLASLALVLAVPAASGTSTGALDLPALVVLALAHNLTVKVGEVQIGEAQALYEYAAAQAYPVFSGNVLVAGPTPEARTLTGEACARLGYKDGCLNHPDAVTSQSLRYNFEWGTPGIAIRSHAEAAQPLYTFGKIGAAKDAARHAIDASRDRAEIARADVVLNVHKAYWAYQLSRSFLESLADGLGILARVLKKIEALIEAESPQVTENDRLRLLHAVATVRVRQAEAEEGKALALRALKILVGMDQTSTLAVQAEPIESIPERPGPPEAYLANVRTRRPELRALDALIDAEQGLVELRKNQLWPDVFLGGVLDFDYQSNATIQTSPFAYDPYNRFDVGLGLGLKFELDIWTKLAVIQQAEASLATRLAQSAAARQGVDLEIRKLHDEQMSRYARRELLDQATRAARSWLNAAVLAYDIGTGDARELIDSFIARATSEGELKKTLYDIHLGDADLDRAAGRLLEKR